jgi:hypothetical protein
MCTLHRVGNPTSARSHALVGSQTRTQSRGDRAQPSGQSVTETETETVTETETETATVTETETATAAEVAAAAAEAATG